MFCLNEMILSTKSDDDDYVFECSDNLMLMSTSYHLKVIHVKFVSMMLKVINEKTCSTIISQNFKAYNKHHALKTTQTPAHNIQPYSNDHSGVQA